MTIPHVPSNPQRIAYAAEQNALIDQCNETSAQTDQQQSTVDGHATTLSQHGARLDGLETAPPAHTHPISQVDALQAALDGKASTTHTHALELDALTDVDTTTAVPVSGQVLKWNGSSWAPANDLTGGGGDGTGGASSLAELTDVTLATPATDQVLAYTGTTWANVTRAPTATYRGQWTDAGGNVAGMTVSAPSDTSDGYRGVKSTEIGVTAETPVGCSMSAGTFTAEVAGRWRFSASMQYTGNNDRQRALWIGRGSANVWPSGAVKYGQVGAPSMSAQTAGHEITLAAGETVSLYVACWTIGGSVTIWCAKGNVLTATWLGP